MMVENTPGVTVDNYGGMRAVVEHLIEVHNRTRIAFIRGPEGHAEAEDRFRAYCDVLVERGIPMRPELIVLGDFLESGGTTATPTLLERVGNSFDALVAASDNMAIGAMKVLQARGLRIPDDVALGGVNAEPQGQLVTPPLTTATLRFHEQGYRAAEMFLGCLRHETMAQQVVLPARLIIRQSCGCVDPLVSRTGAATTPRHQVPPADWLAMQRQVILTQVLDWAGPDLPGPAQQQSLRLLDGLQRELLGVEVGAFLAELRAILTECAAAGTNVSLWHDVLSILRRELEACAVPARAMLPDESMWQQARVMIGEIAQRIQASMLADLSNLGWEAQRAERPQGGRLADHTRCDTAANPDR